MIQEANLSRHNHAGFFCKRPKPASSHLPSVIIANDEETSQKLTREWTDPVRQKDKERQRLVQKKRQENQRSDTKNVQNLARYQILQVIPDFARLARYQILQVTWK